ncbi:MAG: GldG family protein [Syntrophaceae bacterium]|nr:GldG family protein [Syntrophaceae bacterium]
MLKKNAKVLAAVLLIALITFSSITLLAKAGRALKVDLTQDRIYSLTDETKKVLAGITHPVRLKLFYSRTEALKGFDSLRSYSNYFFYIRDLLREYASRSRGKITLEIIDPRRDTREEREALQYGLRPIPTAGDDRFYFGLVLVTEFGQEKAIALLSPVRQQLAEYDITEMIHSATSRTKKRIGILSTVSLESAAYPAETARAAGLAEAGLKGPSALEPLKSHYDVTMLAPHSDLRNLDAVVVVHPRDLPEQTLAALDRYVTGGGKLVVFQDPAFTADASAAAASSAYTPGRNASNLNRLLAAWGCEMAPDVLAADPGLAPRDSAGPPTAMTLKGKAISREDGLGTGVTQVRVLNAGALQIRTVPGITATAFLRSSETGFTVRADNPQQRASEGKETVTLGVRLTGRFPSALAADAAAEAPGTGGSKPPAAAGKTAPAVVVFSDVDMLTAPLAAAAPAGGNADLVLSTMEGLTGSVSLASIKARGRIIRPFSAVDRMEEDFEDATASTAAALRAEIAAGERELASLARKSREGEESLLKEEILRSRKLTEAKIARAKEELAALQHRKRAMVESLFTAWKVFILLTGPILVLLIPASVLAAHLLGRAEWIKRKPWKRGI